jgi:uroporphyrinogen III methyltransferase/synthase
MKRGKVYLVGAGPGNPQLLTLKGLHCLKEAQVIVYDRLVRPGLLKFASKRAELIYAGKSPQGHILSQDKINLLLVRKAREGKVVLRLKGGDAFLFARGAEEAAFLAKKRIPFEIVPGVSSAIAVPAYAGIPLTHRDYTSSVGIFTGHEDPTKGDSSINWEGISTGLGTLVFLMGVGNLSKIANNLIRFGRSKNTPCCLIQCGTLPEQKTVSATLQTIAQRAGEARLSHPAVLVVGKVVRLRKNLNWFETKPLFGRRILVTCQQQAVDRLSSTLEDCAASVVELPLIQITPLKNYRQLDSVIKQMSVFDWVVFSSQSGVRHFKQRLDYLGKDLRILSGARLAAIGPKTRMALEGFGLKVDVQPEKYCQEGLLGCFKKREIKGENFLIVSSTKARDILAKGLKRMGATITIAPAYRTLPCRYKGRVLDKILRDIDVITFSSSSSVHNFFKIISCRVRNQILKDSLIATIGPVTSGEIRRLGLRVDIQAKEFTTEGLVEAVVKYYQHKVSSE